MRCSARRANPYIATTRCVPACAPMEKALKKEPRSSIPRQTNVDELPFVITKLFYPLHSSATHRIRKRKLVFQEFHANEEWHTHSDESLQLWPLIISRSTLKAYCTTREYFVGVVGMLSSYISVMHVYCTLRAPKAIFRP